MRFSKFTKWSLYVLGVALILVSLPMDTYTDQAAFLNAVPRLDSARFHELRPEYLTLKHKIYDSGVFLILTSALVFGVGNVWTGVTRTISTSKKTIIFALSLPLIISSVFVFDVFRMMFRDEVPVWADSPAIRLMGVPIIFIIFLIYFAMHLLLIPKPYPGQLQTSGFMNRKANAVLFFSFVLMVIIVVLSVIDFLPYHAAAFVLAAYLVASIGASRVRSKQIASEPNNTQQRTS